MDAMLFAVGGGYAFDCRDGTRSLTPASPILDSLHVASFESVDCGDRWC